MVDYKRLFERLKCYSLVMFDDEFITPKPSKSRIIRDFATMDIDDQSVLVEELSKEAQDLAGQLKAFIEPINQFFSQIDWKKDILIDDFESAFSVIEKKINNKIASDLKEKYTTIDESELLRYYPLFMRYGLCISIPSCYQSIIEEYEQGGRRKKLRTYSDFTSKTQESFEKELRQSSIEKTVICIVDNCLTDRDKAQEILECINSIGSSGSNIIGTIFTSKDSFERVDERLCFVCTPKSKANQLALNIVRSAYHYFLARLQDEISENINEAFKNAKENKHIANFLSQRAIKEGISNYEVIQNWIKLMYEVHSAQSDATKRLIGLARIIDDLEDNEDLPSSEDILLNNLNTWEIFDYRVNAYHLPPMPGDIFATDDGRVFILIGQDCDMAMSETRKRRVAAAELLPVELFPMNTTKKIANDLANVWIANYKHSDERTYCMKVDYKHRMFIDGRILDMSAFNADGDCSLDVQNEIDESIKALIQPYLVEHHGQIVLYFDAVQKLKDTSSDVLSSVMYNDQCLYTSCDYEKIDNRIRFPLKRICRLKQTYVFFLYKLYLEYRGRQPFETINYAASLIQRIEVECGDKKSSLDVTVRLGSLSFDAKIHKLTWLVDKQKLGAALKELGITEKIDGEEDQFVFDKGVSEILLVNGKKIKFEKKSNNRAKVSL